MATLNTIPQRDGTEIIRVLLTCVGAGPHTDIRGSGGHGLEGDALFDGAGLTFDGIRPYTQAAASRIRLRRTTGSFHDWRSLGHNDQVMLAVAFSTDADTVRVATEFNAPGGRFWNWEIAADLGTLNAGDTINAVMWLPTVALAGRSVSGVPDARGALVAEELPSLALAGRAAAAGPDARGVLTLEELPSLALAGRAATGAADARGGLRVGLAVQYGTPVTAPLPEVSPAAVMAHAGDRLLEGADSATQRLRDALLIARGTYPAARDYGSTVAAVLDRSMASSGQAALSAAIAEAITHPANGLSDVRLRSVRVATEEGVATIDVEADWISQDGTLTPIGLREQLAAG